MRRETITASKLAAVRRFWMIVPARGDHNDISLEDGHRIDRFDSAEGSLEVLVKQSNWPLQIELDATGNTALGKGSRGYIPLYLNIEARDIALAPEKPLNWTLVLTARPPNPEKAR